MKNKRILVISWPGKLTVKIWSGTNYFIFEQLRKRYGEVEYFYSAWLEPITFTFKAINKILSLIIGKKFVYASPLYSKICSFFINHRIKTRKYDLIFVTTSAGSWQTYNLTSEIPMVFLDDSTFRLLHNYYLFAQNYSKFSEHYYDDTSREIICRAKALFFSSEWAVNSAVNDYGANLEKTYAIPFGTNLCSIPERSTVLGFKKDHNVCKLFFSGVQWNRKGGDIAVETLLKLLEMGVAAELIIIGCYPPVKIEHPKIKFAGFLHKKNAKEAELLGKYLSTCHLFFLPTRAEAFGMVFGEASSYGMPSISYDTGGISAAVKEGVNGFLLPEGSSPEDFAKKIAGIWQDKEAYEKLRVSSRDHFENHMQWDQWGKKVSSILNREIFLENAYQQKR